MPSKTRVQKTLDDLRGQAADCHACPLWRDATQTVFGEGPARAAEITTAAECDLTATH